MFLPRYSMCVLYTNIQVFTVQYTVRSVIFHKPVVNLPVFFNVLEYSTVFTTANSTYINSSLLIHFTLIIRAAQLMEKLIGITITSETIT